MNCNFLINLFKKYILRTNKYSSPLPISVAYFWVLALLAAGQTLLALDLAQKLLEMRTEFKNFVLVVLGHTALTQKLFEMQADLKIYSAYRVCMQLYNSLICKSFLTYLSYAVYFKRTTVGRIYPAYSATLF